MGKLIVIEGLDGSGKGTQAALLAEYLRGRGCRVREISFPDYESEGSVLVKMYLDGKLGDNPDDTNAYAASMFYAADRYVSYRTDWEKDYLDPDTVVIANRYTTANAYHQLSKLPEEQWDGYLQWLFDFEYRLIGIPAPDSVIYLKVDPAISQQLMTGRYHGEEAKKDIHEKDVEFISRCHESAMDAAFAMDWKVVACASMGGLAVRPAEQIHKDVWEAVKEVIERDE